MASGLIDLDAGLSDFLSRPRLMPSVIKSYDNSVSTGVSDCLCFPASPTSGHQEARNPINGFFNYTSNNWICSRWISFDTMSGTARSLLD